MVTEYGLAGLAGIVLAVFFDWFPWVRGKYELLNEQGKRLVMLVALIVVSCAIFVLGCIPSSPIHEISCDQAGFWQIAGLFMISLATNQTGYKMFKRSSDSGA